ncbi:hypothetical protein FRC03_006569 [Tulasnella sp. 419]|nr:hypothetical protein FRC03_006569 [Tulasnella sp. 419]
MQIRETPATVALYASGPALLTSPTRQVLGGTFNDLNVAVYSLHRTDHEYGSGSSFKRCTLPLHSNP